MITTDSLSKEIDILKARNVRVEIDKAWETSLTRRLLLCAFTYISIGLYMYAIDVPRPWLNAVIPSIGFILSTLTMPTIKAYWMRKYMKV
ncbi:MAG: hypothetical protein WCJ70_03640 [bacterium]